MIFLAEPKKMKKKDKDDTFLTDIIKKKKTGRQKNVLWKMW